MQDYFLEEMQFLFSKTILYEEMELIGWQFKALWNPNAPVVPLGETTRMENIKYLYI